MAESMLGNESDALKMEMPLSDKKCGEAMAKVDCSAAPTAVVAPSSDGEPPLPAVLGEDGAMPVDAGGDTVVVVVVTATTTGREEQPAAANKADARCGCQGGKAGGGMTGPNMLCTSAAVNHPS